MKLLTTTHDFRKAMGSHLVALRGEFDYLPKEERDKTGTVGRKVFGGRPVCALCGRPYIHFAHLLPLEARGLTTADNLLPLCADLNTEDCRRKKEDSCHWLYDRRYASREEMQAVRRAWTPAIDDRTALHLADCMRARLPEHEAQSTEAGGSGSDPPQLQNLIARGYAAKCARVARKAAVEAGLNTYEGMSYAIREIECERRRTRRDALEAAERRHVEISCKVQGYPDLLPLFYYEGGYVSLLQGRHLAAKEMFERSAACANQLNGKRSIEYWIAESAALQCTVAVDGQDSPWKHVLAGADAAQEALRHIDSIHAKRWVDNWNWDRIRIALVRDKAEDAHRLLSRAESHEQEQSTGHTPTVTMDEFGKPRPSCRGSTLRRCRAG